MTRAGDVRTESHRTPATNLSMFHDVSPHAVVDAVCRTSSTKYVLDCSRLGGATRRLSFPREQVLLTTYASVLIPTETRD